MIVIFFKGGHLGLGRTFLVSHPLYDRFALIVSACCFFVFFFVFLFG